MSKFKENQHVWFPKANKKAAVKELLSNGLIRITYFDKNDDRQMADVLPDLIQEFKKPTNNKYYFAVREFHKAFNLPYADSPQRLTSERKAARLEWKKEELREFEEAETLKDEVDAMIDEIYFCIGSLVEMGVKPDGIFDAVQKANMGKLWSDGKPRYREEDGKIVKPPTWKSPDDDIEKEIARQMKNITIS